jgi:hypothetical protein
MNKKLLSKAAAHVLEDALRDLAADADALAEEDVIFEKSATVIDISDVEETISAFQEALKFYRENAKP